MKSLVLSDHAVAEKIDRLCDEFESSWKSGNPLPLEQSLQQVPDDQRSVLFRELLEIEIELRTQKNELFSSQDYLDRFPGEEETINLIFRRVIRRKKLGDYELLDEIGHGGMGIVYRARQVFLNQTVAIKVLLEKYLSDAQVVARFRREMQMIGGLNHPNIVRALNAGESYGTLYLVMEFIEGFNLQQLRRIAEKGIPVDGTKFAFSFGAAIEIIRQAALGLQHAFERGLIHRDVKPANLIVTKNGVVKILDLGLGKFRAETQFAEQWEPSLTSLGATMGTIDYMAPEQWENASDVDVRADIYGLGCTLFYLLVGHAPFDGPAFSSNRKKLLAHVEGEVPSLRELRPDCPQSFYPIFQRMIAKNPHDRFSSPDELVRVLAPFPRPNELHALLENASDLDVSDLPSTPALRFSDEETNRERTKYFSATEDSGKNPDNIHVPHLSKTVLPETLPHIDSKVWIARMFGIGYKVGLLVLIVLLIGLSLWWKDHRTTALKNETDPAQHQPDSKGTGNQAGSKGGTGSEKSPESKKSNGLNDAEKQGTGPLPSIDPAESSKNEERLSIVRDLVQLPGLGGQWWFVETPWFLPFIRETLAVSPETLAQIQDRKQYLNPNTIQSQRFLWELVRSASHSITAPQKELVEKLHNTFELRLGNEEVVPLLEQLLSRYEDTVVDWKASDYHTVALMQHRIALYQSNHLVARRAKESYLRAIGLYEKEIPQSANAESEGKTSNATAKLLLSVCRSDAARLFFWLDNDLVEYEKTFLSIFALQDLSELFRIDLITTYGNTCSSIGKHNDLLFEDARKRFEKLIPGTISHPFAAYIRERLAWSLIEQCKFKEASVQFVDAHRIRKNNLDQFHSLSASIYVFLDQHGIASCLRYLGNTDGAKTSYAHIITSVQEALNEPLPAGSDPTEQQRYYGSLRERLVSSLERNGDCTLYGGAASFGTTVSSVAIFDLKQALEMYEESMRTNENRATGVILRCKAAILKAILGQIDDAKKQLVSEDQTGEIVFGSDRRRALLIRQVADAVVMLKAGENAKDETAISAGQADLRRFLMQFASEKQDSARYRREILELQLFCAELLLVSQWEAGKIDSARADLVCLDQLLVPFVRSEEVRPFLYRFYDLAILLLNETEKDDGDPDSLQRNILTQLRYVRQSRLWNEQREAEPPGTESRGTLFFHFSPKYAGIAIYLPKGSGPLLRYTLPYSRIQIKEAGETGKKIPLPQVIVDLIAKENPIISFQDSICWYSGKNALWDDNWPFEEPKQITWKRERAEKTAKENDSNPLLEQTE